MIKHVATIEMRNLARRARLPETTGRTDATDAIGVPEASAPNTSLCLTGSWLEDAFNIAQSSGCALTCVGAMVVAITHALGRFFRPNRNRTVRSFNFWFYLLTDGKFSIGY